MTRAEQAPGGRGRAVPATARAARLPEVNGFVDRRPAAAAQRQLSEGIGRSPQVAAQRALGAQIHNGATLVTQRRLVRSLSGEADEAPTRIQAEPLQQEPAQEQAEAAGGTPAAQRQATVQRDPDDEQVAEDKEAWMVANQVHGNMLLDAGHLTGSLMKKAYLWAQYRDVAKRKRIAESATEKTHLIDKNMYGRGKVGAVMRSIDTASRIMHLIGSIAGLVALAANIAAFFAPAALPVGVVAGVIALAAHSAMAVLQTILIGRNLYRIRGLPEAEKAKILPTLYRDIAKLGFSLLGVITGGVGLGAAVHGGGLLAHHALEGAEAVSHGLRTGGDVAADTLGTYSMGATIAYQNEKENKIGLAGGLGQPAGPSAQPGPGPVIPSDDQDIAAMGQDHDESVRANQQLRDSALDSRDATVGLAADLGPVRRLSEAEPQARGALASVEAGEAQVDNMPKPSEDELQSKDKQVARAEGELGLLPGQVDEQDKDNAEKAVTQKATAATTPAKATVQREEKPGLVRRAINWLKRKFSSFKKRVKRVFGAIQAKLTELVLKMAGVKNLPAQMDEALDEHRAEAAQVAEAAEGGSGALVEWKGAMDKMGKS